MMTLLSMYVLTSYDPGSVHYLPQRAVVLQNRDTTKVRIVFGTLAQVNNESSLNDILYFGPCLLPSLHDILIRYQIRKIGILVDVQQAFLQIEIDDNHRDFLQFIWFDNVLSIITHHFQFKVRTRCFSEKFQEKIFFDTLIHFEEIFPL